jgi:hypothetical protein
MSEPFANAPSDFNRPIDPGGAVPADDSPVPAGPATLPMGSRAYPGPHRLVLRAASWVSVFPAALAATVVVVVVLALERPLRGGGPAQLAGLTAVLAPVALIAWFWYRKVLLPRVTFDREAGELVLGWRGRRGRRPLSSVLGVQVMKTQKRFGGPEQSIPAMTMYQVNLILDDPAERRVNLMTCDPLTARSTTRVVADFLGVPVLDSAAKERGAEGAAAPVTTPHTLWVVPAPVVTEPEPDVLLIRPRRLAFLTSGRWMGMFVVPGLMIVLAFMGGVADWTLAALGAGLGFSVLMLLVSLLQNQGRRAHFDRARGVLSVGRITVESQTRPLASVKAVEVVGGSDSRMNLVLDDEKQPLLTLITDTDGALVWRAAERVASFLGVPLLDARRRAAADPAGAAWVVNPLESLHRSPLPPGKASVRGPAQLVPKGLDALVLRPRAPVRWGQLVPAVISLGAALYLFRLFWPAPGAGLGQTPWWVLVLLVSPLSGFAAVKPLLLYRDHFDRQVGLLTFGWFGLRGTYPLANLLAVQLIPGGLVDRPAGPFGQGRESVSYQLNLVTADVHQDRLNLTDDSDLEWSRRAGQQLAEFLGVPLIDQVADDD